MNEALQKLLNNPRVWRASQVVRDAGEPTLPTGYPELNAVLPGGGWPAAALTEILVARFGLGELNLVLPTLARLSRQTLPGETDSRWIVWISPPHTPYAPALAAAGVSLSHTLIVQAGDGMDRLWAAEQSLRCGACAAVVVWADRIDGRRLRRLQLAAEEGVSWGVVFRPDRAGVQHSPAALRLRLSRVETGVTLAILKSRGGRPRTVSLEGF